MKVVPFIIFLSIIISATGCTTHRTTKCYPSRLKHSRQQISNMKSTNRARKALDKKIQASEAQYTFCNNQIIIFENNP